MQVRADFESDIETWRFNEYTHDVECRTSCGGPD
jgi:hypothetical protein